MLPLLVTIRISSLGDVVLAASAVKRSILERSSVVVLFITSVELVSLVECMFRDGLNERELNRVTVVGIDRSCSIFYQLNKIYIALSDLTTLKGAKLAALVDLHGSLRSRILIAYLRFQTLIMKGRCVRTFSINKQRISEYLVYLFRAIYLVRCINVSVAPWWLNYSLLLDRAGRECLDDHFDNSHVELESRRLASSLEERRRNRKKLPGEPPKLRVGIASDAGHPEKAWGLARFKELAGKLMALYPHFEVVWFAKDLVELSIDGPIVNLTGRLSVAQVADEVRQLDIMICNDSGLLHLAEYFEVPVVAIFGPTHTKLGFGPRLDESIVVDSSLWCRPCSKFGNKCFRPFRKQLCLSLVTVDDVLAAFKIVSSRLVKKT